MASRSVKLHDGSVLRIRPYRPEDHDDVIRIFSSGMLGLARDGAGHVLQNSRPLKVLTCALPAVSLLVTPKRFGLLGKAFATLGAAAVMPCVAFTLLRRAMKRYVKQSMEGAELGNIEEFYSTAGAGHGSAFWVAELVEPGLAPALSATPDLTVVALSERASRGASAASEKFQDAAAAPLLDAPLTSAGNTASTAFAGTALTEVVPSSAVTTTPKPLREVGLENDGDAIAAVSASAASGMGRMNGNTGESCSSAAADLADGEEHQARALVAGLVAAAVARIEAAASLASAASVPSQPTSASPSAPLARPGSYRAGITAGTPDPVGKADEVLVPGSKLHEATGAAKAPPPPQPQPPQVSAASFLVAPGTPAAVVGKRPRIGSFAEPAAQGPAAAATALPAEAAEAAPASSVGSGRRPTIIGHVALERKSWKLAELRRMSVLARYAGQGVGGRLLETLVQHARDVGFRELVLHTSGMQPAARRLYERGGWAVSKVTRMQGMDVYTYTLDLTKKR